MEGRAQFGIDWMASLLVEREAGYDVVIISQVFTRAGNSEITMAKSNIRQPSDLKGKNVCVWYGGNELSLRALFDESKMKWDNDTSINQQSGSDANCISQAFTETEFLAGHCDAAAATRYNELALVLESINPATGALYSESTDLYIFNYADYNITTFEDGLFVSKAWLEQPGNKDIALRFMRATIKGSVVLLHWHQSDESFKSQLDDAILTVLFGLLCLSAAGCLVATSLASSTKTFSLATFTSSGS